MSTILRSLAVSLGLDVDAQSFAKGALAASLIEKGLEAIVEVGKEVVEFFVDVAKEAIETAGRLNDTSQAIGVTTDALQELQYAGGLAGISAEEMTQAITILSKTMAKAKEGGEEQAKAFAKIGVKVKDATGKLRPAEDVMGDIADHFKAMPDGAEKTAKAVELFGRSGARMISMLNEGGEGLADLRQEAHELGLVMDADSVKLGDDIGDNIDRLKGMWAAIKGQAGAALFPVLKKITDGMVAWVKANKELIKQRLTSIMMGIAKAAKILIEAADVLWGSFKLLYDLVAVQLVAEFKIFTGILDELGIAAKVAAAIFVAGWLLATAPIIAIVAGVAQILLFLNSIQRFREGRDSVFGDWMKALHEWAQPNANDPWWVKAAKDLVNYLQQALGIAEKLGVVVDKVQKPFNTTQTVAKTGAAAVNTAVSAVSGDYSWLAKAVGNSDFAARFDAARAGGAGVIGGFQAGFGGGESAPALPPGGGVLRAPVQQSIRNNFVINPSAGMSEQDIADAITERLDEVHESAAAALGD